MKRTKLKKKSVRGNLREKVGALHLRVIKKERNNYSTCQICGRDTVLGRFHILPVGKYPKLEFVDQNIILSCWMPCHYAWHHDYEKAKEVEKIIKNMLGDDYREKLKFADKVHESVSMTYLNNKLMEFQSRLDEPMIQIVQTEGE